VNRLTLAVIGVALAIPTVAAALGGSGNSTPATQPQGALSGLQTRPVARNMTAVGHLRLGGRRFNGDVWVHRGHAYVGDWNFSVASKGRFCQAGPNDGVAVIDIRRPARPRLVSRLRIPAGTWAEDVVAYRARSGPARGRDIAIAGIQICGGPRTDAERFRGFVLWDVSRPSLPVELGRYGSGCCSTGVHSLEVRYRADLRRTFVYAAVPYAERVDEDSPSGRRDHEGRGEFRLVDVTSPSQPAEVSTWGVVRDARELEVRPRGCLPLALAHAVEPSADGRLAFVSYWDAGVIALDVSRPERPVLRGRTVYGADEDGDAHSAAYDERRKLLLSADEDFCNRERRGYGYLRVWDWSRPGAPRQIGSFRTPRSRGAQDGNFLIHNPVLAGNLAYISWYEDGVRVVDVSNPRAPREVASFVPPPERPSKRTDGPVPLGGTEVWGVVVDQATGLAYASDIFSGLWILKHTG